MLMFRIGSSRFFVQAALLVAIAIPFFASAAFAADAYQWEDGAGHIFFGENPPPTAKNVKKLNAKRYSKYSSEKLLAPYKKYVRAAKLTGDTPLEQSTAETTLETEAGADSVSAEESTAAVGKLRQRNGGKKVAESDLDLGAGEPPIEKPSQPPATGTGEQRTVSENQSALKPKNSSDLNTKPPTGEEESEAPAGEEFPVLLEQGDLSVRHNKKNEVIECSVVIFNHGTEEARGVVISFQFADGTVIPGGGPGTIASGGQAQYSIPKGNLPVKVHSTPVDGGSGGPIPSVLIQSAA